ncbi:P2Y purinoceptor 11 [Erpetoichthys calabaricus]|uniref:P2Y purinoceptor 11 n=1 Tax=Erpetoichthys calabaricus TaxID=27687 RepID=UPI0010A05F32|nr:P2Y purinoceptor 11 [Erpetoichthys calabaricus]
MASESCKSSNTTFQTSFLPPVYGVEFFLATAGNSLAIWLLLTRERRNWHTGVVFSFNLAVSDLLYVLSLPLLVVYYTLNKNWIFSEPVCKIERFLFTCNLYASIFFITSISLNRYVGIVHPLFAHSEVRPRHAKLCSVLVWIVVIGISAPTIVFSETNTPKSNCTECLGSASDANLKTYLTYSLFLVFFGCLLPFLLTFGSYVCILCVVWKNNNISKTEKRKVGLMILTVILLYTISFIPYHLLRNINLYHRINNTGHTWVFQAYQVTKGLVTLNMCIHPLLYASVFDSMRHICSCVKEVLSTDSRPGGQS